jgi:polysaccharide export outer membrane protein
MMFEAKNKTRKQKQKMPMMVVLFMALFFLVRVFHGTCAAQNAPYQIGPRDILTLTIHAAGETQSQVDLTVSAQGTINVPFVRTIQTQGRTVPELEDFITEALSKDFFVNPQVIIHVKEYHSLKYYIAGAINSPGLYETTSKISLMELLAKSGGVLPERGSVAYIMREAAEEMSHGQSVESLREKTDPILVDLENLLDRGDMSHNLQLNSGDVVYIPLEKSLDQAKSKIFVEGKVKNPGAYDYQPGLTVMSVCIIAGGFVKFAAPNRTMIIRKEGDVQEVIKINLEDVKKGKIPDTQLRPGDRIHVPETWL